MTRQECFEIVVALVSASLVWQDEGTHEVWFAALRDLHGPTGLEAAHRIIRTRLGKDRLAPGDIRAEVRRIRDERLDSTPLPAPPAELCDNPSAYNEWLAATREAVANGERLPDVVLSPRPVRELVSGAFREVPQR